MNNIQNLLDPTTPAKVIQKKSKPELAFPICAKNISEELFRFESLYKHIRISIDKIETNISALDYDDYICDDARQLMNGKLTHITEWEFEQAKREAIIRLRPEETESLSVVTSPEVAYNTHPC